MSAHPGTAIPNAPETGQPAGSRRVWRQAEDLLLVVPLLALMALPLSEIVLRRFHTGISGAAAFVQHFTLIVGMIGGAIAARQNRLLSFSTLSSFFKGKLQTI